MDFYTQSTLHPSQLPIRSDGGEASSSFPQRYASSMESPSGTLASSQVFSGSPWGTGGYLDEPPLMEELGINLEHIKTKSLTVLNPLRKVDRHIMDDTDLAGPIMYCLLLGASMLLKGKVHFGYIYGVGVVGCLGLYWLLNLMSEEGMDGGRTASVLGYCLLPMIFVSMVSLFFNIDHWFGWIFIMFSVAWCTYSASQMFVTVLTMEEQRFLIGYPVLLFYMCFALMAVF